MENIGLIMNVDFDCSQFFTLTFTNKASLDSFQRHFLDMNKYGFHFINYENMDITKKKILQTECGDYTFEIFNQEFLGEFSEWKEIDKPPLDIMNLLKLWCDFLNLEGVLSVKFILVNTADQRLEINQPLRMSVELDKIQDVLFCLSPWNEKFYDKNFCSEVYIINSFS